MNSINAVVEIPLDDVRSNDYSKNEKKCKGCDPCLICGKPIKNISKAKQIQLLTNGNIVSSNQEFDNSQGLFYVGSDCAKKLVIDFTF